MATKSSNTQGNPYHDEQTGEFTSADSGNGKKEKNIVMPSASENADLNVPNNQNNQIINNGEQPAEKPVLKFKLKANVSLDDAKNDLSKYNQISSIPLLRSAKDVEEHLDQFFTKEIIQNVESKFGKFKIPYKYFNLRTDPNQRCGVNIFAACIGKKRWRNNFIGLIDENEYYNLSKDRYNFKQLFRGLRGNDQEFETIANSYSSKENEMIYGSVGGVCYGIAVYSSNDISEAISYAGGNTNHVMHLVLNKNAMTMPYSSICRIRDDLSNRKNEIVSKAEQIFLNNGIEPSKAKQMAASFGITLGDEGFVAMLCGVEWYQSGSYHMIENLGSLFRLMR